MTVDPIPDPPVVSRGSVIAKQVGVILLGLVLAAVMVGLGVWQLRVYNAQGEQQARDRASAPPVALESVARPGQEVGDAYGRQVRFTGTYDPRLQVLVSMGSGGRYRVLTGLRLPNGGILPVVRGAVTGHKAPDPPAGQVTGSGVFMPSEGSDAAGRQAGAEPTTVVLPSLAQRWTGSLVNGFATLNADQARAEGLDPVTVELPSSHGRLQNGFYALQWWVFAGFAIWMAFRMAGDLHRTGGLMGSDPGAAADADDARDPLPAEAAISPANPSAGGNSPPDETTT
jgi:cytochrome oxidase assembly protein ShyY1